MGPVEVLRKSTRGRYGTATCARKKRQHPKDCVLGLPLKLERAQQDALDWVIHQREEGCRQNILGRFMCDISSWTRSCMLLSRVRGTWFWHILRDAASNPGPLRYLPPSVGGFFVALHGTQAGRFAGAT